MGITSEKANVTGEAFEKLIAFLLNKEDEMLHITSDHPEYNSRYKYRITRLHLQDTETRWSVDGDERHVLRVLLHNIQKLRSIFCHVVKVLRMSSDLELAVIVCASTPEFTDFTDEIFIDCRTDEQIKDLVERLITAIRTPE